MSVYIFIPVLLVLFIAFSWFNTRGNALTGWATVVSRRVGNSGNRLVTFRFADGDELELYVSAEEYKALTEGTSGTLVWHRDVLSSFDKDLEVRA